MNDLRKARIHRKTKETEVELSLQLDGGQQTNSILTSVPFFDHMLTHISVHGHISTHVDAKGDTDIDFHHLVEDTGIAFAMALKEALGNFAGINRYGHFTLPMDETLVTVAIDFSGRPFLHYQATQLPEKIAGFDSELAQEFFKAIASVVPMSIHILVHHGQNGHHILEGIFKCFGRALRMAINKDPMLGNQEIPSSKGII